MKVLIANAAGTANLGDLAITKALLNLLLDSGDEVIVHAFVQDRFDGYEVKTGINLYAWLAFEETGVKSRLSRLGWLSLSLVFGKKVDKYLPEVMKNILDDYRKVDKVLLIGGGYFRSRKGLLQQINAVFSGVAILVAKRYGKRIEVRPISFGPFGSKYAEVVCGKLLSLCDVVMLREEISYKKLSEYVDKKKLELARDEAYGLKMVKLEKKNLKILGFSVREWGEITKEKSFVKAVANRVEKLMMERKIKQVLPIIQADVPDHGEGDREITEKIVKELKKRKIKVMPAVVPKTVESALKTYGQLDYLIGMRMHSCIMADIQHTEFEAIAYEHKHFLLDRAKRVVWLEEFIGL